MIPKGCPGHKTGRIRALLPVNIFCFSIIGAKLKAEKHALWAALRSAACGGALRRCAAPSAAARRFAPPLRGATRPARCARSPFANTKKMPLFRVHDSARTKTNSNIQQLAIPVEVGLPSDPGCTYCAARTSPPSAARRRLVIGLGLGSGLGLGFRMVCHLNLDRKSVT